MKLLRLDHQRPKECGIRFSLKIDGKEMMRMMKESILLVA